MKKITMHVSPLGCNRMHTRPIRTVRQPLDYTYLLLAGKFVLAPAAGVHPLIADISKIHK